MMAIMRGTGRYNLMMWGSNLKILRELLQMIVFHPFLPLSNRWNE